MTDDRIQTLTSQIAVIEDKIKKAERKFYAQQDALDSLYGQLGQMSIELSWREQGLTEAPKLPSWIEVMTATIGNPAAEYEPTKYV